MLEDRGLDDGQPDGMEVSLHYDGVGGDTYSGCSEYHSPGLCN